MTERGRKDAQEHPRRSAEARPDALFGEIPPPLELSSLFGEEGDVFEHGHDDDPANEHRPDLAVTAVQPRVELDPAKQRARSTEPVRTAEVSGNRRTEAGRHRAETASRREKDAGEKKAEQKVEKKTDVKAWPSVNKEQGRHPLRSKKGRARTARKIRRVATIGSLLPWFALPLGLLILAVILIGLGNKASDDASATSPAGSAASSSAARSAQGGQEPSIAPEGSPTAVAKGTPVQLKITIEDLNGSRTPIRTALAIDGKRLVSPTSARALPLRLSVDTKSEASLTLVLPQVPDGTKVACFITATGGVLGQMSREASNGILDCSTKIADIAAGGS